MTFFLSTINLPTITPSTLYFLVPPPILDPSPSLSQLRRPQGHRDGCERTTQHPPPARGGAGHGATRRRKTRREKVLPQLSPRTARPTLPQGRGAGTPQHPPHRSMVLSHRGRASEEEQSTELRARSVGAWKAQPICCQYSSCLSASAQNNKSPSTGRA